MPNPISNIAELALGLVLLILGWILVFLMVVFPNPYSLVISMVSYAISLLGLILALHGFTSRIIAKKKQREQYP